MTIRWAGETDVLAGTGMAEDISALTSSLAGGDWVESGLHAISVGLGGVGAAVDPVGAIVAAGAGWAMEHLEPMRTWLDELAGDPPAVMADSARLRDASGQVTTVAEHLRRSAASHVGWMEGQAVEGCMRFTHDTARATDQFAALLQAGASAMQLASGVVDAVRGLVRDVLAEVVGMATSSAVTVALTAGTATPVIAARFGYKIESLVRRAKEAMESMARSFEALRVLLARAESVLDALARASRGRRPLRDTPLTPAVSTTWSGEVMDRLATIRPTAVVAGAVPGGAATVFAGPESEAR